MKFQILIFDGFEEMDVFGVFEALRMAGFDVPLVSLDAQEQVTGFYGARVIPDAALDLSIRPDALIVPGGGWIARAAHGAWAEAEKGTILSELKSFYAAGTIMVSVCAGAMVLARAGLLAGRPSTTNVALLDELSNTGARIITARVVDDGDIITASGITASLDLGLWLIERFASIDKALEVSRKLEFESRGPVWKAQGRSTG